jgi:hypothetical protein
MLAMVHAELGVVASSILETLMLHGRIRMVRGLTFPVSSDRLTVAYSTHRFATWRRVCIVILVTGAYCG